MSEVIAKIERMTQEPSATQQSAADDARRIGESAREPDVSGYVRRVRRRMDVSQRELAAAIGVNQATISRIESGSDVDVRTLARVLGLAGLRLVVVDEAGASIEPMPRDVFRDRAGRRQPSHLDVHALPETPTMKMLFRSVDPVPASGSWFHMRAERDRLRARAGVADGGEQLSVSAARARRAALRARRYRVRA